MAGAPAPDGTQKGRRNRQLLVGIAASLGLVFTFLALFSHQGLYRIYCLRQERQSLEQENARLAAENNRLERTIDRLRHDPELIQDLIRQKLHFVKKNEIIFQLPPEGGTKSGLAPPHPQAERRGQPGAGGQDAPSRIVSGAAAGAAGTGALRRGDPSAGRDLLSTGSVSPGR